MYFRSAGVIFISFFYPADREYCKLKLIYPYCELNIIRWQTHMYIVPYCAYEICTELLGTPIIIIIIVGWEKVGASVVVADVPESIYAAKEWFAAEFRTDDLGGKLNLRNVYVTSSVQLHPLPWSDIGDRMLLGAMLICIPTGPTYVYYIIMKRVQRYYIIIMYCGVRLQLFIKVVKLFSPHHYSWTERRCLNRTDFRTSPFDEYR